MADPAGLLDTSVVIDHDLIDHDQLPEVSAISAITLAELSAGPAATDDDTERARRQDRLQWATATWDPLPFDGGCARAFGSVTAAVRTAGRAPRSRMADLLIAATALSNGLPLYTRNPQDFAPVGDLLPIRAL